MNYEHYRWPSSKKTRLESALGNLGTSEVFYSLIKGKSTLTDISENLSITRPSVIEQLRRLQKAGLVKLGAKNGKFQHYALDLRGLSHLFLSESTKSLHFALTRKTVYPSDEVLRARLPKPECWKILTNGKRLDREQMFSQLKAKIDSNTSWKDYLLTYLETYAKTAGLEVIPISQVVREFENGLRLEAERTLGDSDSRTWADIDQSKKELVELLQIWAMLIKEVKTLPEAAHESSLREILGWQILEELGKGSRRA